MTFPALEETFWYQLMPADRTLPSIPVQRKGWSGDDVPMPVLLVVTDGVRGSSTGSA